MKTRELFFKLRLCHGIGIQGEHRIYKWLLQHHDLHSNRLSALDIVKIAGINQRYKRFFKLDYFSQNLRERIRLNSEEHWLSILDHGYPKQLRESPCPPNVIFYRGNVKLLSGRLLGVVGARKHSSYAVNAINKVLPPVIKKKLTIVAGLAEGVDSLGHICAITNGGNTIGVIGTGLDRYYPANHQKLQSYMEHHQLVITEYPLGAGPRKFHFPNRNRIIAGLIQTIIIVEARRRSGSLITAGLALQDNRNVTAIPGRIDSPLSDGCNQLIMDGAKPIRCAEDVLEEFRY